MLTILSGCVIGLAITMIWLRSSKSAWPVIVSMSTFAAAGLAFAIYGGQNFTLAETVSKERPLIEYVGLPERREGIDQGFGKPRYVLVKIWNRKRIFTLEKPKYVYTIKWTDESDFTVSSDQIATLRFEERSGGVHRIICNAYVHSRPDWLWHITWFNQERCWEEIAIPAHGAQLVVEKR